MSGTSTARRATFVGVFLVAVLVLGLATSCGFGAGTDGSGLSCTNGCTPYLDSCGTYCSCSVFNCSFGGCCYFESCSCDPGICGCY
jgi:hypothetical protein